MTQFISFTLGAGLVLIIVSTVIIVKALLKVNTNKAQLASLEEWLADTNRNMMMEIKLAENSLNHRVDDVSRDLDSIKSQLEMKISESDNMHFENTDKVYSYVDSRIDKLREILDKNKKSSKELLKG
tara:strand:- start:51 stop:431 length:381 start_codon:yes stop_codon:yes gene_type:complete